jgi:hypothetical protein
MKTYMILSKVDVEEINPWSQTLNEGMFQWIAGKTIELEINKRTNSIKATAFYLGAMCEARN